ncbi:MAG: hypothetical protein WBN77_08670 [Desulfobacterales bacterium]
MIHRQGVEPSINYGIYPILSPVPLNGGEKAVINTELTPVEPVIGHKSEQTILATAHDFQKGPS